MSKHTTEIYKSKAIIEGIEITSETLTGRAGLSLFVRYLRGIGLYAQIETFFGTMRRSRKGQPICEIFKQLFCFFVDGTSRHLVYFDSLKEDEGYARGTETEPEAMLSSHALKRFFRGLWWPRIYLFRRLLQRLFLWRLGIEKPPVVILGVDTMVMDNDEARVRHGVKPTYKRVKGFQPLQMSWGRFVIDAVFRRGDAHSNHCDTVQKMVRHVVGQIRKHYRADVPIVLRLDSGFFDQKLMEVFEELEIGYVNGGKLYDDIKAYVSKVDRSSWGRYEQSREVWEYVEMGDKRRSWKRFRRALFCRPLCEESQFLLEFSRPDTLLYSNLGRGEAIDHQLIGCARSDLLKPEGIIGIYHGRGSDELVHRALKDFGSEQLPFKRFAQNAAFYYTMLTAFFLYESFKEDVCAEVVAIGAYATTLRRRVIDFAAKIVRHGGKVILKVTAATWNGLRFVQLWERSGAPPRFAWA
jgi:hypothetical protein